MNILHLISSGGFYGAESVVAALAREQSRTHTVQVGVFENSHAPENRVAAEFEMRGIPVMRIPCRRRIDLRTVGHIRSIIWQKGIGLVHSHGYKADIYAHLAARRMSVPLIATAHHWTGQTAAVRLYEFFDGLVLNSFHAVVAVSERIASELRGAGVNPDKITVIDNGINLERFNAGTPALRTELQQGNRLLIGTAGRLVSQKGISYFLEAAQRVLQEFPDVLFVVVGDGPEREALQQLAGNLGIQGKVSFLGARADMANVYASLDVFVLASLAEGMPMAALEALASGLPVVATDVGAVSRIIVPGQTGMLVHPADSVELAQAVLCLLRDPALRQRLARNGNARVHENFSSAIMARNYESVYEQLHAASAAPMKTTSMADQRA